MYNYPAMLAHAATMEGYAGTLQAIGGNIAAVQATLAASWTGETGMTYQAWQTQWNAAMEELGLSYRAFAGTHDTNTMYLHGIDTGNGASWV
jgi:WXG100 family type VII secretion target